jgi:hypothetical protein
MPIQTRQSSRIKNKNSTEKEKKVEDKEAENAPEMTKDAHESVPESDLKESSFWLMKSEPEDRMQNGQNMKFGIEDLKKMKNQTEHWDGVSYLFYLNLIVDFTFNFHSITGEKL